MDDHLVTILICRPACSLAFEPTPDGTGMLVTFRLSTSTTMRVITSIHGHTSNARSTAKPSTASRLSKTTKLPVRITCFADRCAGILENVSDFTARETDLGIFALVIVCDDLGEGTCRAAEDSRALGAERDGVDNSAAWDESEGKDVACLQSKSSKNTERERGVDSVSDIRLRDRSFDESGIKNRLRGFRICR